MRNHIYKLCLMLAYILLGVTSTAQAQDGVVRAVLFYSPSCPHCHGVMTEDVPPLLEKYGAQLEVVIVDTAHPDGNAFYQAAIERFDIAPERRGIPTLIVGDNVLVGSIEIPQVFPVLVEDYLDEGGVDWPDLPGFAEALDNAGSPEVTVEPTVQSATSTPRPAQTATAVAAAPDNPGPAQPASSGESGAIRDIGEGVSGGVVARFTQDVVGNSLSVFVLLGMVVLVAWFLVRLARPAHHGADGTSGDVRVQWLIPLLVLVGIVVSVYMAYVETTHTAAVCGPVGDCNTVQQSEYAMLFGRIPIGLVGIGGYAALGVAWLFATYNTGRLAKVAQLLLPAMALVGTLFSIYLTFLEPFVIGATCLWCLTSAITISLILLLSADGGRTALGARSARRHWQGSES
ncbi:MAG: vitamin K epoxide reductase family protein [Chloroflexota bacterium]